MVEIDTRNICSVEDTIDYNKRVYANYYRNSLIGIRYDLLYRTKRLSHILKLKGIDPSRPGFRAFEYGFGGGHLLHIVSRASEVVGMESSPTAVARARARMPKGHPHWEIIQWDDATRISLEGEYFDLVTASHVLEHLPDDGAALNEWIRLVRPGGYLLILLPSHEVLFKGSKHLRVYDIEGFTTRLEQYGLERVIVDEHQRFDRPFKHRYLVLASRKNWLFKIVVDAPKTLLFLPLQLISWRILAVLDEILGAFGAKSSSVAYLFRKRTE